MQLRIFTDTKGTYDLSAVVAVTKGGGNPSVRGGPTVYLANAHLSSGDTIATATDYETFVNAWIDFTVPPVAQDPKPAPLKSVG